MVSIGVE